VTVRFAVAAVALLALATAIFASTQPAQAQPGPTPTYVSELGPASVVTPTAPPAATNTPVPPTATPSPTTAATSEVQGIEQAPADEGDSDSGPLGTMVVIAAVLIAAMLATGAFFARRANRR
jgi:hypothetical protein